MVATSVVARVEQARLLVLRIQPIAAQRENSSHTPMLARLLAYQLNTSSFMLMQSKIFSFFSFFLTKRIISGNTAHGTYVFSRHGNTPTPLCHTASTLRTFGKTVCPVRSACTAAAVFLVRILGPYVLNIRINYSSIPIAITLK
jgi:hypothetical protein